MEFEEPTCTHRNCIHYLGMANKDQTEDEDVFNLSLVHFCNAFSVEDGGIPDEIAYGKNLHLVPLPNQKNDIIFQKRREA